MFGIKTGPFLRQYLIVIFANLVYFQFGVTVGWMSPAVVKLREESQTILPYPLTDTETAWVTSISSICALMGFFYVSFVANHFGRKSAIFIAVLPRVICCFLLLFASRVWMLYLARAFGGMSDYAVVTVMSMYTSEIASKEIRGALATVSQILSTLGVLVFLSIGPYVSYLTLNIVHTSIILVTSIPLFFMPESPYFLYSKGKSDEAVKILTYLRGDTTLAYEELKEYSSSKNEKVNVKDLLKDPIVARTLGITTFLIIGVQFIGYAAVINYLQIIFESTGTSISPEISSVIVGCIQLFACICTIMITDRFGRKPVLVPTLFLLAVGLIGLGTFFNILDNGGEIKGFLNYLPLISMILVVFCYNAGIGSLIWILIAELYDGPSRAFGITASAIPATVFTFFIIRYFSAVADALGSAAIYWIFASCCLVTCLSIAFVIPETKGKAYSQIQNELVRKYKLEK